MGRIGKSLMMYVFGLTHTYGSNADRDVYDIGTPYSARFLITRRDTYRTETFGRYLEHLFKSHRRGVPKRRKCQDHVSWPAESWVFREDSARCESPVSAESKEEEEKEEDYIAPSIVPSIALSIRNSRENPTMVGVACPGIVTASRLARAGSFRGGRPTEYDLVETRMNKIKMRESLTSVFTHTSGTKSEGVDSSVHILYNYELTEKMLLIPK
ncbi:hypothetical protein C8J57DRAFT_1674327 [Mycena rebaudengoi]|nr:hypothetical protein C8J57DRAFT_1674327 [Mycena rebaudengoi]